MDLFLLLKLVLMLFIISDAIGNLPIFISLTGGMPKKQRKKVYSQTILVSSLILVGFALIGKFLLGLFNIELSSFAIAGGVLLMILGIDIIKGKEKEYATNAAMAYVPMATPLMAGPGAMTAVLLMLGTNGWVLTILTVFIVFILNKLFFWKVDEIHNLLGENGSLLVAKLTGIIVTSIGVGFIINGIKASGIIS